MDEKERPDSHDLPTTPPPPASSGEPHYGAGKPSPYDILSDHQTPRRRTWHLVSAIAGAAIITLAIGGYAVLGRNSAPDFRGRQPSRICASPYGESKGYRAQPVPLPGEEVAPAQQEQITTLAGRVEEVRGLRFKRPVETRVVTRESFREWVRTALKSDTDKGQENEISRTVEIYKFLNLVPPDSDFAEELASA